MLSEDAEKQGVEHIECLFNELSEKEKVRAKEFLTRNADVFSRGEFDIGRTAMSLEALDKSKDIRKKAWRSYEDLFDDEPCRKKEKLSRFAVKAVEARPAQVMRSRQNHR